ncbi:unnamed protein product [Symbiodinium natans]|uniref:Uncharacterized protein n=1 Tax=Symbiodinium natans TaxID=878477 RepID=A0A812UT11_9DINO|nr:unnamed protein product [Symbiodinium natans]
MEAHVAEVEAARTSLEGRPGDSGLGALSPLANLGNLGNLGTSSQATTQMDPAYTSPAMVGPRSSGQSSAVVTAEKILRAWDSHDELESATGSGPFSIDYPKQTFQSDLTTSQSSPARGSLKQCLLSPTFEVLMSALVLLNLAWMAVWCLGYTLGICSCPEFGPKVLES